MKTRLACLLVLPVMVLLSFALSLSSSAISARRSLTEFVPTPRLNEVCDTCEPNHTARQACGPLTSAASYRYPIRCISPRDDDFYYIDLAMPGTVTGDLKDIPSEADYDLYLYDYSYLDNPQQPPKCHSDRYGSVPEHFDCSLSQAGRYYIRVYPYNGCRDDIPYTLAITYPTPLPTPIPTAPPPPPCNVHVDDFEGAKVSNDLGKPVGWTLDPPGCGGVTVTVATDILQVDHSLAPQCTARYTSTLEMSASPYKSLMVRVGGDTRQDILSATVGLSDQEGHAARIKVGDVLDDIVTDTIHSMQPIAVPLPVFASKIDTSKVYTFFIELTGVTGTTYLDNIRLEQPRAPIIVDNYNDLSDPNALGGALGINSSAGAFIQKTYTTSGTHAGSAGSHVISYSVPAGEWASWKTDLLGLDVSAYAYLSLYMKGAKGDEKVNLYLQDQHGVRDYVDVETYTRVTTNWALVRVPLQAFESADLTQLSEIQLAFEWAPMTSAIMIDDLKFDAGSLLVDNFCDDNDLTLKDTINRNSLNWGMGTFASSGVSCQGLVTATAAAGALRLEYDVTAGQACYSGYYSQSRLDLTPYRSLVAKVRGERCGEAPTMAAGTMSVQPDKIKLSDFMPDGLMDEWQQVSIPLASYAQVKDWTRGDAYAIAFEAYRGASKGSVYLDDVAFKATCNPVWVDNFNDQDSLNALQGGYNTSVYSGAVLTASMPITQAHGDTGAGLWLTYSVPSGTYIDWETSLRGLNVSSYQSLVFDVRGDLHPDPHIYLMDDLGHRKFVHLGEYATLLDEWYRVTIPLKAYSDSGVDLTRLSLWQFVIEYESTYVQGRLAIDNIRFVPSAGCDQITLSNIYLPIVFKDYTPPVIHPPVWDFESGLEGWTYYKTYTPTMAVVSVEPSSFRAVSGTHSLAMIVDLIGGHDNYGKGAAYRDIPNGPRDLACKPISCWVYVPTCGSGDPAAQNEVQLFVKDSGGKLEHGTPFKAPRNQWFEVTLRPSTVKPFGGDMDDGFNPAVITRLGVRFRAGSDQARYQGKVYVDACGWQEIDPRGSAAASVCAP